MAEDSYPDDLLYHPEHDWARIEPADPAQATLGITWYAQDSLGEVELVKAVSDVIAPLSGEIVAVNDALTDNPHLINEDPYGEGWLVKLRLADSGERDS